MQIALEWLASYQHGIWTTRDGVPPQLTERPSVRAEHIEPLRQPRRIGPVCPSRRDSHESMPVVFLKPVSEHRSVDLGK